MYKEFFNFDADTIFSFSFNKPCWDISLFFPKIFFKKKERKIKIIVEHLENGIRNHGNLSPIPKIGEPFRKLVPHPLLRYPCLVLDFTLDPTNCFPRNEIKGGGFPFRAFAESTLGVRNLCFQSIVCREEKSGAVSTPFEKSSDEIRHGLVELI